MGDENPYRVRALIDTGAEVSLVRKGLVGEQFLHPARIPLRILGANNRRVEGGTLEVTELLEFDTTEHGSHDPIRYAFQLTLHEADIAEDIILSYAWLANAKLGLSPWRHRLELKIGGRRVFVPGLPKEPKLVGNASGSQTRVLLVSSREATHKRESTGKYCTLDLSSGAGCARGTLEERNFENQGSGGLRIQSADSSQTRGDKY